MSARIKTEHSGGKRRKSRAGASRSQSTRHRSTKIKAAEHTLIAVNDMSAATRMWTGAFSGAFKWAFNFLHSSSMLSLPLFGLLAVTSMDFLILLHFLDANDSLFYSSQPVAFEDPRRDGVEQIKKYVLAVFYLLTIFLTIVHLKEIVHYFRNNKQLMLLPLILIVGVLYSVNPAKVVTNTILITISLLVSALFFCVSSRKHRLRNFYLIIFLAELIVHASSAALLFYLQVDIPAFVAEERRYGGFAGNPNTLGSTSILGIWASICLIFTNVAEKKIRWFAMVGLLIFAFNLFLSGSGTSLVTVLLIFSVMIWMRVLGLLPRHIQIQSTVIVAVLACLGVASIFVFIAPGELMTTLAGSLGKDTTLTGRTDLWQIASSAISDKAIWGWSFDSHESVKSNHNYTIVYHHYHNGFLDVLVAGGMVLLGFMLFNFTTYVYSFQKAFTRDPHLFPLIVPLVILLVHNLGEYSLVRPLSIIWQVYITTFVLLTHVDFRPKKKIRMTWRSEYSELVSKMAKKSRRRRKS